MIATRYIALLRGINVGGRSLKMAALKAAAIEAGYADCATYIQSGNLLLSSTENAAALEASLEALIERGFGMQVGVIARARDDLARIAGANPFPDAIPKMLHLGLTKHPPRQDAPEMLAARATNGERIAIAGGALWIDFGEAGVGNSKLLPAVLDKAAGSTLTGRNWNTVRTLVELACG